MKITNNLLTIFPIVSSIALIFLVIFLNSQARNHAELVNLLQIDIKDLQERKNQLEEQNRAAETAVEDLINNIEQKKELSQTQLSDLKNQLQSTKNVLESLVAVSPRPTCGDPDPKDILPTNSQIKISWYPVFVSTDRLDEIRQHFCKDAFLKSSIGKVQVSSFWTKNRAEDFSKWIKGEVGKPGRQK